MQSEGDSDYAPPPTEEEDDEDDPEAAKDFVEEADTDDNLYETSDEWGNVIEIKGPARTEQDYKKTEKAVVADKAWKELDRRFRNRYAVIAVSAVRDVRHDQFDGIETNR